MSSSSRRCACVPLSSAATPGATPPEAPHTVHAPAPPRSARTPRSRSASAVVVPCSAQPMASRITRRAMAATSAGSASHASAATRSPSAAEMEGGLLAVTHPHLVPALVRGAAQKEAAHARPRHVGVAVLQQRDGGQLAHDDLLRREIVLRTLGLRGRVGARVEELVDLGIAVA